MNSVFANLPVSVFEVMSRLARERDAVNLGQGFPDGPFPEVVLFQPLYDAYLPLVQRAGGVPRFVRLEPPQWRFTEEQLARAFTSKTKVVLFNNPLNPSATVFPRENLELLARYCEKFDAI